MRFSFDLTETDGRQSPTPSPSTSTPEAELQWVPLQNHPLFVSTTSTSAAACAGRMLPNLMVWDGASRLYVWDSRKNCLHRISIQLGEPDPASILAASPSKVLRADVLLSFEVNKISINRNGSALLLVGLRGLCVMYLYGRCSAEENSITCRTVSIGSEIYFNRNNLTGMLQVSWHPYSDTHLGILSSDSIFRIFDLSTSTGQPEQEYYLQPVESGGSVNAAAIGPVDFSFGRDHLWDRFCVFVLFTDGSIYIICPVVPFGSVYKWESILEMYTDAIDAHTFGLKCANSKAANNSNLAITWLEATFPELVQQAGDVRNMISVKAQPFVLLESSASLQGPLHRVSGGVSEDSEVTKRACGGRAVSFLYNLVGKDSILVTAWSSGKLQLDALADEIQPVWKTGSAPRLCLDSSDQILGAAMICETPFSVLKSNQPLNHTVWSGHPPPLLSLAIVDLALPNKTDSIIAMMTDPLVPERIFCIHSNGIDSIVLHYLPFTSQTSSKKDEPMRTLSVISVLNTCSGESGSRYESQLHGFLAMSDSFGSSWIVGLSSSRECIVLQMDTWNVLLTHVADNEREAVISEEQRDTDTFTIISKELLNGPKEVFLPSSGPRLRTVTADSIEGRSTLHQYFRMFHENYVEYAHKVYFELQHHAPQLKKIIDNQHSRLREGQQKLLEFEKKRENIVDRIDRAIQQNSALEGRLRNLKTQPIFNKKPLSKAERNFKLELDRFNGVELDALRSSIKALRPRLQRHIHSPQANSAKQQRQRPARSVDRTQANELVMLKSSLAKLSLINSENSKKVKLVESALKNWKTSD